MQEAPLKRKIGSIHALRGVASLAVCWFHFTNGNPSFLPAGLLKSSGVSGWLGVEMFFVISGFVIPYSLFYSSYRLPYFPRFLVKRILRLDPPYFASILLVLVLAYASSRSALFAGGSFSVNYLQLVLHMGYLNAFSGTGWLNPVFWSLAIEFQYYLLIGLVFPFILSRNWIVRLMSACGLFAMALSIRNEALVFQYLLVFLMGILVLQHYLHIIRLPELLLMSVAVIVGCATVLGYKVAAVTVFSACVLIIPDVRNKLLWFFGDISYSLYLVHVPIGGRVINLSQRFVGSEAGKILVLLLALLLSAVVAYLLFRLVEKPSQKLAASLSYAKSKRDAVRAEPLAESTPSYGACPKEGKEIPAAR